MEQPRKSKEFTPVSKEQREISHLLCLFLLFLALVFLSSCGKSLPQAQEMGNMALLRSFAVDLGENGTDWKVTASTGKQANGLAGNQEPPTILQGESATIQGACDKINGFSQHYVFYGYVDQLILGESLAEEGILKPLEYFTTNPQLSLGTGIWLSLGEGADILFQNPEEGASQHLYTINQESDLGLGGITRKAGEVLAEMKTNQATYVPVLQADEQGALREGGYGIVSQDKLVALLQGDLAKGLALLECHDQLLELEFEGGAYALSLSQIKDKITASWAGNLDTQLLSFQIHLDMEGKWLEYPKIPSPEEEKALVEALEAELKNLALETIWKLQDIKTDPLNFQGKISLSYPQHRMYLRDNWENLFAEVYVDVEVCVNVEEISKEQWNEYK